MWAVIHNALSENVSYLLMSVEWKKILNPWGGCGHEASELSISFYQEMGNKTYILIMLWFSETFPLAYNF